MSSSSQPQPQPQPDQDMPHPIPGLNELGLRISHGERLERAIKLVCSDFTMRMEQHALLMIADQKQFGKNGALSTNQTPQTLKRRLEGASPLCKHYWMHHMSPNQTYLWEHAQPRAPIYRPDLTLEDYQEGDWETISQKIYYDQHFHTDRILPTVHPDQDEIRKCRDRDRHSCVVTKETKTLIFSFIPPGWTNNVINNDATGNLEEPCPAMTDVNLITHILSPFELGRSNKAWNMICVDPDLHSALTHGWCGFRYEETNPIMDENGQRSRKVQVVLIFYWVPQLSKARFNEKTDAADLEDVARRFDNFISKGCPAPSFYPKQKPVPRSGDRVNLQMLKEDGEKLKSAVKVHWGCVAFSALCGGAGRPHFLTGMDQSDGSLQPRDKEFALEQAREAELGKPIVSRPLSSLGDPSAKASGDQSSDPSSGAPAVFSSEGRSTGKTERTSASGPSRDEQSSK